MMTGCMEWCLRDVGAVPQGKHIPWDGLVQEAMAPASLHPAAVCHLDPSILLWLVKRAKEHCPRISCLDNPGHHQKEMAAVLSESVLDQNGPKWSRRLFWSKWPYSELGFSIRETKMDHFSFWPEEVHLGPPTVLWPFQKLQTWNATHPGPPTESPLSFQMCPAQAYEEPPPLRCAPREL